MSDLGAYPVRARSWLGRVGIAIDRTANAILGGPEDQTLSQTLGFSLLHGERLGRIFAPIVDLIWRVLTGERHHCIRSLYRDDGRAIWLDRMPDGAPLINPYP